MPAVRVLVQEHARIQSVLDAMDATAVQLRAAVEVDPAWLRDAANFLVVHVDGTHHAKEEGVLFKELIAKGLAGGRGPIATLLAEHNSGRGLAHHLSRQAREYGEGNSRTSATAWATTAVTFAQLLRSHINKEEKVLFPLARELLPLEVRERLEADYANIEALEGELGAAAEALCARTRAWWPDSVALPR